MPSPTHLFFLMTNPFFGRAIVGGPIHSVLEVGGHTAEVAVRILGGERAGDIKTAPVEFAPPKFDWREMRRWGISENIQLPPGSVIHFRRQATIWEAAPAADPSNLRGASAPERDVYRFASRRTSPPPSIGSRRSSLRKSRRMP